MAYMIQIEESKVDKMAEYAEKMLKYGGKLMQCIDEVGEESGLGHRGGRYGDRDDSSMGERRGYGNREDWEDDDDDMIRQRRRRSSRTGRFM